MGGAGGQHADDNDSAMSLSNMTILSDVGPCEPGRFHLTGLGVFIQLFTFRSIYFAGRLTHRSCPAVALRPENRPESSGTSGQANTQPTTRRSPPTQSGAPSSSSSAEGPRVTAISDSVEMSSQIGGYEDGDPSADIDDPFSDVSPSYSSFLSHLTLAT